MLVIVLYYMMMYCTIPACYVLPSKLAHTRSPPCSARQAGCRKPPYCRQPTAWLAPTPNPTDPTLAAGGGSPAHRPNP